MASKRPGANAALRKQTPREIPIRLPDETIRGLLNGSVTQLRLPVQGNPRFAYACVDTRGELNGDFFVSMPNDATQGISGRCPFGEPGDVLWVREEWAQAADGSLRYRVHASGDAQEISAVCSSAAGMPRSASRITLLVRSTGVSRLRAMTRGDARTHGYVSLPGKTALDSFRQTWDATYPRTPWSANPWVWVLEVESISVVDGLGGRQTSDNISMPHPT